MAMTDLRRPTPKLRAAVVLAGNEIRKLNFGRADRQLSIGSGPCAGGCDRLRARDAGAGRDRSPDRAGGAPGTGRAGGVSTISERPEREVSKWTRNWAGANSWER